MCDNLIYVGFAQQFLTSAFSQLGYVNKMILNHYAFKSDILVIRYACKYLMTMVDGDGVGVGDDDDADDEKEEEAEGEEEEEEEEDK